ncbi:MAG: hypothetical protein ACRDRA_09780 [Pseudonocardiaceae bacterium]
MSRHNDQRLTDILAAAAAIADHITRGERAAITNDASTDPATSGPTFLPKAQRGVSPRRGTG